MTIAVFVAGAAAAFAAGILVGELGARGPEPPNESARRPSPDEPTNGPPSNEPVRRMPPETEPPRPVASPAPVRTQAPNRSRDDPKSIRTAADFGAAIAAAFDAKHAEGLRPTEEDLEIAALQARDRAEAIVRGAETAAQSRIDEQVQILESRLALRAVRGVLADGAAVLELRARGRSSVAGDARPGTLQDAAFDPFAPLGRSERSAGGVVGGVLLPGRVFVVERIELAATLGQDRDRTGSVSVRSPTLSFPAEGRIRTVRAVFTGSQEVADLSTLALDVQDASARVRFVGRVVLSGEAPESRPFEFVPTDAVGFLRSDTPIRLQILADHGGGNPREVDLAGNTSQYFRSQSDRPVWDESTDLRKIRESTNWTENTGVVPPGCVFHVVRIDWRVRLLRGEKLSRFDVRASGESMPIVAAVATADADEFSGTWTGDLLVRPGNERHLRFACHYFGMADLTVYGRVEKPAR